MAATQHEPFFSARHRLDFGIVLVHFRRLFVPVLGVAPSGAEASECLTRWDEPRMLPAKIDVGAWAEEMQCAPLM